MEENNDRTVNMLVKKIGEKLRFSQDLPQTHWKNYSEVTETSPGMCNLRPWAICGPLNFPIWQAELEETILLVVSK